jgi:predicted nucleic acid-binding Zn ribbon protein
MSKFKAGDTCYFDDDKGEVLEIYLADRGPDSYNVLVKWGIYGVSEVWESDLLTQAEYDALDAECNGICLTPADIGLPEYSSAGIAYAHPDCPVHGDPIPEDSDEYVCSPGEAEDLRYVREEDVENAILE